MVDLQSLSDSLHKAQAKAKRLRAQADTAEREANEIETAIRVIERMSGADTAPSATAVGETGAIVLQYVGYGPEKGRTPKEIHEAIELIEGGDIGADNVRTQLWRMAKRGILQSEGGRYWRKKEEASNAETSEASNSKGPADGSQGRATHLDPEGSIPSGSTPSQRTVRPPWENDDDVPF